MSRAATQANTTLYTEYLGLGQRLPISQYVVHEVSWFIIALAVRQSWTYVCCTPYNSSKQEIWAGVVSMRHRSRHPRQGSAALYSPYNIRPHTCLHGGSMEVLRRSTAKIEFGMETGRSSWILTFHNLHTLRPARCCLLHFALKILRSWWGRKNGICRNSCRLCRYLRVLRFCSPVLLNPLIAPMDHLTSITLHFIGYPEVHWNRSRLKHFVPWFTHWDLEISQCWLGGYNKRKREPWKVWKGEALRKKKKKKNWIEKTITLIVIYVIYHLTM